MSEYLEKYDVASEASGSILGSAKGLALATATDVVTTLWNSLPLTPEIKTEDVLANLDRDALSIYNESGDTVKSLSLVGGSLIPGTIGLKLLNRARAGLTSLGYTENFIGGSFAGTRQTKIAEEVADIFRSSGSATAAYKTASRNLLLSNVTKEVIDNAAIELAIVGTMNAHPYMEDYLQDPVKNFALGAAFGSLIGAGFAVPSTRRLIMDTTGNIASESLMTVAGAYRQVDEAFTSAGRFQGHTANAHRLGLIAADETQTGITREIASSYRLQEAAAREEALLNAAPWVKDYGPEVKTEVEKLLGDSRFIGVDKIRFYDLDKAIQETAQQVIIDTSAGAKGGIKGVLAAITGKYRGVVMENNFLTPEGKAAIAFTRLSTGEIFAAKGARSAALAVDIKDVGKYVHVGERTSVIGELVVPVTDFGEDNLLRVISSARSDARFLRELKLADKADLSNVGYVTIAPDDLPRMNAMIAKAADLPESIRNSLKINLRSDLPNYQQAQQFIEKTVGKDYTDKAKAIVQNKDSSIYNIRTSTEAHDLVGEWVGGNLAPLRRAMDAFQRGTPLPRSEVGNERLAAELWNAGKKSRDEFSKIADADGYVYLYRGIRGNVKGHAAVESYTVSPGASANFGTSRIFRVHVDNIIGSVNNPSFPREMEVLVGAPHQQIVNNIPVETGANRAVNIPGAITENTVSLEQLGTIYADETERQIQAMIANKNFSVEEISARLNVKKEGIVGVMSGANLKDLQANVNFEWRRYTDPKKIDDEYLHPKHKLYAVVGSPVKNPHAESMANLDARQLRVAHTEIIEQMTALSQSMIGNRALEIYKERGIQLELDRLMDHIGQINNQLVGNPVWQSADNALRKLISSPVLTYVGKQVINQSDKIKKEMLEPLAATFLPFKDKPAMVAEFNAVVNKLYSLEGWREIRVGDDGKGIIVQAGKAGKEVPVTNADGTVFSINQKEVLTALEAMRNPSNELLRLHNLNRSVTGKGPLNDLGFYVPPISLVGKSYAFVLDTTGQYNARLLTANSGPELEDLIQAFKRENATKLDTLNIFRKGEQDDFNLAKGYTDYEAHTTYANVAFQHKGSSSLAIVPSDSRFIENIISSYENLTLQGVRRYSETYLQDVTGWLDRLSAFYKRSVERQPKTAATKESASDAALTVKNILLGRDQLEQSPILKSINTTTDMLLNRAYTALNNFARSTTNLKTKESFDALSADLKSKGVQPIWSSFDEYLSTTRTESKNVAPLIVSTGNGLLATMQLRMFEVAQAAVNIMSLPILTWSALMNKLPGTVVNAEGDTVKLPMRVMYAGMRQMFSPEGKRLETQLWEPKGLIDQTVRQYTEVTGALKGASQGGEFLDRGIQALTDFQNSKIVNLLSSPADFAEKFTRRYAMHTGYWAAKQAYPGLDDAAATVAAVAYTDRIIGNYHAAQRPTAFQGTFGAALGLYQTYFLTFAQHVYRGLEDRNFKQLAGLAGVQAGLFGMSSWPGFNLLSEQVVARFNDNHYDLTTGTFRAADKDVAEMILYGLPSSLGPAYYTRGDISPRIPGSMTELAVLNGTKEGFNAAVQIIKKAGAGLGDGTPIQSLFEALSLQSLNRPIARWSELVTGSSLTQKGNTVSPQNEVWTPMGVFARLLATRPIEEQVTRNARHLDTFYGQVDFERRQDAVRKIKTAVREGKLDDDLVGKVALDYLRFGGTSKGWNAALNEALTTTEEGTRMALLRKLEPDSPIRHMINDLW